MLLCLHKKEETDEERTKNDRTRAALIDLSII